MWIEVFKTGRHTSSDGREFNSTEQTINEIIQIYNFRISESDSNIAPLVLGHPKDNQPAVGWIEKLGRRGNKLVAKLKDISPEILNQIKENNFKKVSISLYPDLMLRHVGLLGAVSPAVKGLKNLTLAEFTDFENCIEDDDLDEKEMDVHEKLELLEEINRALKEKLQLRNKQLKKQEFMQFSEQIGKQNLNSMLTPANSDKLIEILEIANQIDADNNSEFSLEAKIRDFLSNLKPLELTKEFKFSDFSTETYENNFNEKNTLPDRMFLHDKAMKIKSANNLLSYEDAVIKALSE